MRAYHNLWCLVRVREMGDAEPVCVGYLYSKSRTWDSCRINKDYVDAYMRKSLGYIPFLATTLSMNGDDVVVGEAKFYEKQKA